MFPPRPEPLAIGDYENYLKLVAACNFIGIPVRYPKRVRNFLKPSGDPSNMAGCFSPDKGFRRARIRVWNRSTVVLAHEFSHALYWAVFDRQLPRRESELSACATGYMLATRLLGYYYSPYGDAGYALEMGASPAMLEGMRPFIMRFSELMHSVVDKANKGA